MISRTLDLVRLLMWEIEISSQIGTFELIYGIAANFLVDALVAFS